MYFKKFINPILCLFIIVALIPAKTPSTEYVSSPMQGIKLYILMYHGFTQNGTESEYVINAQKLEDDIIYLKNEGYRFIDVHDLLCFLNGKNKLPQKNVMLTFDDGYMNNYTYAFPILKKHNVKAVISPIGYYVEVYSQNHDNNPAYAQLSCKEIKEMYQSGLCEFQNHSYNMHSLEKRRGSLKKDNEDLEVYKTSFYDDLKKAENLLKEITGDVPLAYTFPFGLISSESEDVLNYCGYRISFGCEEGVNIIYGNESRLFKLKRFNRTPDKGALYFTSSY